jgi:hypothetical protein
MDLKFDMPADLNIDLIHLQKLSFIFNAIESGWSVKKRDDNYIFSKKHEGKKEVYLDTYLQKFIETNFGGGSAGGSAPPRR